MMQYKKIYQAMENIRKGISCPMKSFNLTCKINTKESIVSLRQYYRK